MIIKGPNCHFWGDFEIGSETLIGAQVEIGGAKIGDRCSIQSKVFIPPGVTIGDEVFIGPGVVFTNCRNPVAYRKEKFVPETTTVEDGAMIGANATVLSGVTIGKGAKIAAGATVTKDVLAGETYIP